MKAPRVQINRLVIRVPGMRPEQARALANTVAESLAEAVAARLAGGVGAEHGSRNLGALRIRISAATARSGSLGDVIAARVTDALR